MTFVLKRKKGRNRRKYPTFHKERGIRRCIVRCRKERNEVKLFLERQGGKRGRFLQKREDDLKRKRENRRQIIFIRKLSRKKVDLRGTRRLLSLGHESK